MMTMEERAKAISWPNPHAAKLFLDEVDTLRYSRYMSEKEIASRFDVDVVEFRLLKGTASSEWLTFIQKKALEMKKEGYSTAKIADDLRFSETMIIKLLTKAET